jgi:DNA-3-methyladenine glycosylase II
MDKQILDHLRQDPVLCRAIDTVQLTDREAITDVYYYLLEAIVSQQLSVKASDTIFKRFLQLFENQYPVAEKLVEMDIETLRSVGLSQQKAAYLRNVAQFALEKGMEIEKIQSMSDEEAIVYLSAIKGVGKWTVEMILMNMNRLDVFPYDDLGIRQAMIKLYGLQSEGKTLENELFSIADRWIPYRSIACRYLWRWKDAVVSETKN